MALGLVIAGVELFMYFRIPAPEVNRFIPSQNPIATTMIIDGAIRNYLEDHNGTVPDRLEVLIGKYLPPKSIKGEDLDNFIYNKTSPSTYELIPLKKENDSLPPIMTTEEGVKIGESG